MGRICKKLKHYADAYAQLDEIFFLNRAFDSPTQSTLLLWVLKQNNKQTTICYKDGPIFPYPPIVAKTIIAIPS